MVLVRLVLVCGSLMFAAGLYTWWAGETRPTVLLIGGVMVVFYFTFKWLVADA